MPARFDTPHLALLAAALLGAAAGCATGDDADKNGPVPEAAAEARREPVLAGPEDELRAQ